MSLLVNATNDPQSRLYPGADPLGVEGRAAQIRHLSILGIAAEGTSANLGNLGAAYQSLFEVIHRLADEIEVQDERERLERHRSARGVA